MLLRTLHFFLLGSACAARSTIQDYYEITEQRPAKEGEAPIYGGCTPENIALLTDQWEQMQDVSWAPIQAMSMSKYGVPERPRKSIPSAPFALVSALSNFMAIKTNAFGSAESTEAHPLNVLQSSKPKRKVLRRRLQRIVSVLTDGNYPWKSRKTQLYCDSTALRLLKPDSELAFPPQGRKLLKEQLWYDDTKVYWWMPHVRRYAEGERPGVFLAQDKVAGAKDGIPCEAPKDDPENPTFCLPSDSKQVNYAWTILPRQFEGKTRKHDKAVAVTILCPNYFDREDSYTGEKLPSKIDTEKKGFPNDVPLDAIRPQWLTLYTQIVFEVLTRSTYGDFFNHLIERRGEKFVDPAKADKIKDFKTSKTEQIQTADQCLVLAEYDWANVFSTQATSTCIKSPNSIAWYSLVLFMWFKTNTIWSEDGKCRQAEGDQKFQGTYQNLPDGGQPWTLPSGALPKTGVIPAHPGEKDPGQDVGTKPAEDDDPEEGPSNRAEKRPRPPSDTSQDGPAEGASPRLPWAEQDGNPCDQPLQEAGEEEDPYGEPWIGEGEPGLPGDPGEHFSPLLPELDPNDPWGELLRPPHGNPDDPYGLRVPWVDWDNQQQPGEGEGNEGDDDSDGDDGSDDDDDDHHMVF